MLTKQLLAVAMLTTEETQSNRSPYQQSWQSNRKPYTDADRAIVDNFSLL